METVTFTPESFRRFKRAYEACKAETFWFEDNQYLKGYAMYLIEYLTQKFKNTGE